jgi:hypothetical protein
MAFARIPEQFPRQKPFRDAGTTGRGFFVDALSWSNEHRTDGFIAEGDLRALSPGQRYPLKLADLMLQLGLFLRVPGGYQIPPAIYRVFNLPAKDLAYAATRPPSTAATERPFTGSSPSPGRPTARSSSARSHANSVPERSRAPDPPPPRHSPPPVSLDSVETETETRARDASGLRDAAAVLEGWGRKELAKKLRRDADDLVPPAAAAEGTA